MHAIEECIIQCPYCGEPNTVLCDCTCPDQNYVEDCQACCQPIVFDVAVEADLRVDVRREND